MVSGWYLGFFLTFSPAFKFRILTVFLLSPFFSCLFHIHFLTLNIRFCIVTMIRSAWSGLIVLFQVFFYFLCHIEYHFVNEVDFDFIYVR